MACGTSPTSPLEYWLDWAFVDGTVCTFGDKIGVGVTMLLFFGITFFALYGATDSVMVPLGVLIVLAPITVAVIPVIGAQFALVIILLALAAAGMMLFTATQTYAGR